MSTAQKYIIGGVFVALTIGGCVLLIFYWKEIEHLAGYGYPFVFVVSFLAGCSIPNPAPYIIIVFALSSVLNPALVGAVSGLAAGIGGTLVYLFGRGGRRLFPKIGFLSPDMSDNSGLVSRWTSRVVEWTRRRGLIVVFLMSAMFNPFFAPMAIAIGAMRFHFMRFFLMCWAGNTVKSLVIAYCGYFGLGALLRWVGLGS